MMRRNDHCLLLLLGAAAVAGMGPAAHAGPGDAQGAARLELRKGAVRSLRDIERKIVPTMPGWHYMGPEYDPVAMAYRLRFIRDGQVVFVDVDARSGEVIQQSR